MEQIEERLSIELVKKLRLEPIYGEVLIVEDEMSLRTVLDHVLYSLQPHFVPVWVDSVEKALSLMRHQNFSFIISDYFLAGPRTGLDLWSIVHRRYADTPFLMVSGMGTEKYLKLTQGLVRPPPYLSKPFTMDECKEALQALFEVNERGSYVS